MLEIKDLNVKVIDRDIEVIQGLNLTINDGEIHAIMGPNGTGKSTLVKTIMGHYKFAITGGTISFNGKSLNDLTVDERAKLGIFLAMQDPTEIDGVNNSEFLKTAKEEISGEHINYFDFINEINKSVDDLKFSKDMIHRSLNKGFSGGEKKKNEILQMKILKPKFIILDEIDSGLDIDSLKIVCSNINDYRKENPQTSLLIITHYPRIFDFLKPNYVHVMNHGTIEKSGDINLAYEIENAGYNENN